MSQVQGEPRERWARFASDALDWPAVRECLLRFAPSPIGRRALLEIDPRSDDEARAALARARELQESLGRGEEPPLDGHPDPFPSLRAAVSYRRSLSGEELALLAKFLRRFEDLGQWLAARRAQLPSCERLWTARADLGPLRERLESSLDPRGGLAVHASQRLARLGAEIASLTHSVDQVLKEVARRPQWRSALAEAGRVQVRGGRRMLAVRARHASKLQGVVHDRSQTGETLFVEPHEVVASANHLSELEADARAEEARILLELTREVLAEREALELYGERVGELELALISARFARACDGRPARLAGENGTPPGLVLRAWRHPLLLEEQMHPEEQMHKERPAAVVPIDLRLGADFDLLVVTGPNTGGKTLALKGAGLAALMTRLGFALPCAEGTSVPLYDGILADVGDEQEIQQNLSTFSSHLARIRAALERAGENTLVLLDELGSGTDPSEGAALGEAILEELLERGTPTLATTHLGQLKAIAFRHARAENAHVEFDLGTLAPLYSLVIGAPGESRALAIARRLGLSAELVERARERLAKPSGETDQLMEQMRGIRLESEKLRSEVEARLVEAEERLRELERERTALALRGERLEAEAQRLLEERLARARAAVERVHSILPQVSGSTRAELERALAGLDQALGAALLSDKRRDFLTSLKKGSLVWLPRFKKRCEVVRIHKARGELVVKLGQRSLTVRFDDVTFLEGA